MLGGGPVSKPRMQDYYSTPEWRARRDECLQRYGNRCAFCNGKERVQAHHRTYARMGRELPHDVVAVCGECHTALHDAWHVRECGNAFVESFMEMCHEVPHLSLLRFRTNVALGSGDLRVARDRDRIRKELETTLALVVECSTKEYEAVRAVAALGLSQEDADEFLEAIKRPEPEAGR
jgi:hypothetical protein